MLGGNVRNVLESDCTQIMKIIRIAFRNKCQNIGLRCITVCSISRNQYAVLQCVF